MENRVANVLEAVRGLAALLVIVQHTTNFKNTHLGYYLDIGKFGVVIFFCISGYLMIASARKKSPGEFLVSRFFRLYPMYWVSIFLGIIVLGFDSLAQI
ncbi:acyltransferase, partial [Marinobacter sp. Hex_13]|uniref:acyltransferase family protein n=1 Tax=Marinobacter sp. Hex_13 TaxID=1795866 RepID=UPI002579BBED